MDDDLISLLHVDMTKAEVRDHMKRSPDDWSRTTRKYRTPAIWVYGEYELTFNTFTSPRRHPYPGPRLLYVRKRIQGGTVEVEIQANPNKKEVE